MNQVSNAIFEWQLNIISMTSLSLAVIPLKSMNIKQLIQYWSVGLSETENMRVLQYNNKPIKASPMAILKI